MKIRDLFDKEKENVFFFEIMPDIDKAFVEFSSNPAFLQYLHLFQKKN